MVTLAACIIVKNEENNIEKCLNSIRDFVDEIIVVDTGSDDKTKEIAKRLGAKVFDFKWTNDFSAARNFALKQTSCDWVFQLDADETLAEGAKIRELTKRDDICGAFIQIHNKFEKETKNFFHTNLRLFRNTKEIFYEGKLHENVINSLKSLNKKIINTDIKIIHYGYLKKDETKHERNTALLKEELEQNPEKTHLYFYLGRDYFVYRNYQEAIKHFNKFLEAQKAVNFLTIASYLHLGLSYMKEQNPLKSKEYLLKAVKIKPNYIDALLWLGEVFFDEKNYKEAAKWYKLYLSSQKQLKEKNDPSFLFLHYLDSDNLAKKKLAACNEHINDSISFSYSVG
ncbi:glycosyltransferase [Candidatus Woesearchaeota archaeon]|nr:glycosyltransferase [Candidatus Woesearchaeota archaeon]